MNDPVSQPQERASRIARAFFGAGAEKIPRRTALLQWLLGAVECAVLVPLLFYWRFGEVGGLGWGTTIFFVGCCLLAAIGLYFGPRPDYHTPVGLRGDWADRVGAFWLMSCVLGPFLGSMITSIFPITVDSWRWLYTLRVILAAGVPLITALPLTRYLRGKAIWVALPLLVVITLLPMWSVVHVGRDLLQGPIVRQTQSAGPRELYLPYTEKSLGRAN